MLDLPAGRLAGSGCHCRRVTSREAALSYWVAEGWEPPLPEFRQATANGPYGVQEAIEWLRGAAGEDVGEVYGDDIDAYLTAADTSSELIPPLIAVGRGRPAAGGERRPARASAAAGRGGCGEGFAPPQRPDPLFGRRRRGGAREPEAAPLRASARRPASAATGFARRRLVGETAGAIGEGQARSLLLSALAASQDRGEELPAGGRARSARGPAPGARGFARVPEEDEVLVDGEKLDPIARLCCVLEDQARAPVEQTEGGLLGLVAESSSSSAVRGAAQRERLMDTLRARPGAMSRAVADTMRQRLRRSTWRGEAPDVLAYLERYGEFGKQRELGLVARSVTQIFDALWADQFAAAADRSALFLVAHEQAALDRGHLALAWLMTFQQDPPVSIWARAPPEVIPRTFAPLARQHWATTGMAYLRELDTLQTRRAKIGWNRQQPRRVVPPAGGWARGGGGARGRGCERRGEGEEKVQEEGGLGTGQASPLVYPETWCASLARRIRGTGTALGRLLGRVQATLAGGRPAGAAAVSCTGLFPLPLPWPSVWLRRSEGGPRGSHLRTPASRARASAENVLAVALKFLYSGRTADCPVVTCWRQPTRAHLEVWARVGLLLRSWCRDGEGVDPLASRRGPRLASLLHDLEVASAALHSAMDPYGAPPVRGSAGSRVSVLDANRLRFAPGLGRFPLERWLGPSLAMAYLEPKVLARRNPCPGDWVWPRTGDLGEEELLPLFQKLSLAGILFLTPRATEQCERARPTAAPKSLDRDRFILDRRGMDGLEGKLADSPTSRLPTAARLSEMYVKRHADRLRGSAADWKDMRFQNRATAERAATNIIGPQVRASAVESAGLDAELADLRRREGLGAGTAGRLHGALATLGQGDHAGADAVQMGHKALLVDVGALSPATELDARRPFPQGPQLEGLVLDDDFVVRRRRDH